MAAVALVLAVGACSSSGSTGSASAGSASAGSGSTATPTSTPGPGSGRAAGGFRLTSPDFADGGAIPRQDTCQGAGTRPTLRWSGVPAGATSLVLVVFDPDAGRDGFVHWVIGGLDPTTGGLGEGQAPPGAVQAKNGAGRADWQPPCPPSGRHHYVFTLYALDGAVPFAADGDGRTAIAAVKAEATASTALTGLYQKG